MSTEAITDGELSIEEKNIPGVAEAESFDLSLASLDSNKGWEQLRERIENRINYHRHMEGVDTSKLSLEEIGQKFIVSSLVVAELEAILSLVDNTVKEVRERGGEAA